MLHNNRVNWIHEKASEEMEHHASLTLATAHNCEQN